MRRFFTLKAWCMLCAVTLLFFSGKGFSQTCSAVIPPYTQDFESATVPALPACTINQNVGTGNNWTTNSPNGYGFSSKVLYYQYNSTNAANAWFYTQGLNLTGGTSYRLTYKYNNNSTAYTEKMKVAFGNAQSNTAMTTVLADHPSITGGATTASKNAVDFTPSATGVYYIGFNVYSAANQWNLYVDDISVIVSPTCNEPTALTTSAITNGGFTLDWTPPTTSTPTSYQLYISTSSATPAATATPTTSGVTITGTQATVTGLSAGTRYYVWVRSICSATDNSIWSDPVSFTTLCNSVTTFSQNFDAVTTPALPTCWTAILRNYGSNVPSIGTSTTSSHTANNAVSIYNSGAGSTADLILVSPPLSNVGAGTYRLRFWARNTSAAQDIEVGTLNANTATAVFSPLQTVDINTTYQLYEVLFNTYGGTDQFIGIRAKNASTYSYIYIDDVIWEPIPTCNEPTALLVSNVTSTAAQVDFTSPAIGSPLSYEAYVSTSATTPATSATPTTTGVTFSGTTLQLSGLTPAVPYYVWIRSRCSTTDASSWSSTPATFTTLCNAVTTFSQNFDAVTTPALPTCWTSILRNYGSNVPTIGTSTTSSHTASNAVSIYNSGSGNTADLILVSPPLSNVGAGTHRLRFWARNTSAALDIEVGTLDANTATAVFSPLQTVDINTTYQLYEVLFNTYGGTDQFIGIRAKNAATYSNIYIDDIVWDPIPTCNEPTALLVSNVTNTAAQVDFTSPVIGSPLSYEAYVSTSATTPAATATPTTTGVSFSGNTLQLSGLTPAVTYYVWIRSRCSTTDASGWSTPATFTTQCNAVTTFNEGFDGATVPALPVCWSAILRNYGTNVPSVQTISSTTNAYNSNKAVSIYNSGAGASSDLILVSPPLSNVGAGTHRLRFFAKNSSAAQDIQVGTVDNNTSTGVFTPLQSVDISTTYQQYTVEFTSYGGTDPYIAIRTVNASTYSYVYLDSIRWEPIPTCNEPTALVASNITTSGAQVDFTAPATGSPTSYEVYVSTSSTAPAASVTPTTTGVSISGTTVTLSGLAASTTYYTWVRSRCSATNASGWSIGISFATACVPVSNFPWTENFDGMSTLGAGIVPNCWTSIAGTKNWTSMNAASTSYNKPKSAPNYMSIAWSTTTASSLWTPGFTLTAGTSYDFSFYYNTNGTSSSYVGFTGNVLVNSSQSATGATSIGTFITSSQGTADYTLYTVSFVPSANGTYYFGINVSSTSAPWYLGIDDVSLSLSPSCLPPTALSVNSITAAATVIGWNAPVVSSPAAYQVYVSTSNTAPVASTAPTTTGVSVSGTTASLTGLVTGTNYYIWVRSSCSATDQSTWAGPLSYTLPTYTALSVASGFNYDVVANGVGHPSTSTTNAIDDPSSANYAYLAADYRKDANAAAPANSLPASGILLNGSKMYKLAGYAANNSLKIAAQNAVDSLVFASPFTARSLYLLAVSGSGQSTADFVVNFTDGTTASFAGQTINDWYGTFSNTIASQVGRVSRNTSSAGDPEVGSNGPNLYELGFTLAVTDTSKLIRSVKVTKTSSAGFLNIMAASAILSQGSATPVSLVNFSGRKAGAVNKLSWTTANEQNNAGFTVQRSADGINYGDLAQLPSLAVNGTSSTALDYSYNDQQPLGGANYYRLKQTDKDGRVTLSRTVVLKGNMVKDVVIHTLYPNPVVNLLHISLASPVQQLATLVVTDIAGRTVLQVQRSLNENDNNVELNVGRLSQGTYLLKVLCEDGCERVAGKFVKQ